MEYTALEIKELLKQKHGSDIIITECKTGSTWYTSKYYKFDAWVMKKKWSKPCVIIYEIKVNRSDFLNDHKWTEYLKYCNEFYFVCPPKLIEKNELPSEAGLIWTSINCKRLFTKNKSVYRNDIEIPEDLYRYILMWRAEIRDEQDPRWDVNSCQEKRVKYFQDWLKEKELKSVVGKLVSEKIRNTQSKLMFENERFKKRIEKFEKIDQFIKQHNIYLDSYIKGTCEEIVGKINELETGFGKDFMYRLNQSIENLEKLKSLIDKNQRIEFNRK